VRGGRVFWSESRDNKVNLSAIETDSLLSAPTVFRFVADDSIMEGPGARTLAPEVSGTTMLEPASTLPPAFGAASDFGVRIKQVSLSMLSVSNVSNVGINLVPWATQILEEDCGSNLASKMGKAPTEPSAVLSVAK